MSPSQHGEPARVSAPASTTPGPLKTATDPASYDQDKRVQRLADYADQVLAIASPLVASLGCVELDLLTHLYYLRCDIDAIRLKVHDPIQRARIGLPLAEECYKLAKQLEATIKLRDGLEKEARRPLRPTAQISQPGSEPGRNSQGQSPWSWQQSGPASLPPT